MTTKPRTPPNGSAPTAAPTEQDIRIAALEARLGNLERVVVQLIGPMVQQQAAQQQRELMAQLAAGLPSDGP